MNDLQSKLATLQAQLSEARAELEAAEAEAAKSTSLKAKLAATTRARAAQDVVTDLETEIATVKAAIAQAEREQHRAGLLDQARAVAGEVREYQAELEELLSAVSESIAALHQQGGGIIARWRQARERWLALFATLEPGGWPGSGGDIENGRRLEALKRVVAELGAEGQALLLLPPGLQPSNKLERPSHEGRNWSYSPPKTPEDVASYVLDAVLGGASFASQPVMMPAEPSLSI